jgi:hypothetical protein
MSIEITLAAEQSQQVVAVKGWWVCAGAGASAAAFTGYRCCMCISWVSITGGQAYEEISLGFGAKITELG